MQSLQSVAGALGVNRRAVEEWLNAGCPGEKVGLQWKLNLPDVFRWRVERERRNTLREISDVDVAQLAKRQEAAKTLKLEAEAATAAGMVANISEVEAEWAAIVGTARAKLLGLGAKLGPELALIDDPTACQDAVDSAIREAMESLSLDLHDDDRGAGETAGGQPESAVAVGAASEADSQRVGRRRTKAERGK